MSNTVQLRFEIEEIFGDNSTLTVTFDFATFVAQKCPMIPAGYTISTAQASFVRSPYGDDIVHCINPVITGTSVVFTLGSVLYGSASWKFSGVLEIIV